MNDESTQLKVDTTGFPMIWVEPLKCYVNFLPITKIQFEYFLCDRVVSRQFDEAWYTERLSANPRISPQQVSFDNFEKAFITGLIPRDETKVFGDWLVGREYFTTLPEADDWNHIYQHFKDTPEIDTSKFENAEGINARSLDLLRSLKMISNAGASRRAIFDDQPASSSSGSRSLIHQMLMQNGILEWVSQNNDWGAKGGADRARGGSGTTSDPTTAGLKQLNQQATRPKVGIRFLIQPK